MGNEWTYGYEGSFLFWVYAISRIIPVFVLFAAALFMGAFTPGKHTIRGLAIIIILFALGLLYVFHPRYAADIFEHYRLFRDTILMNTLAALCCFIGYRIGSDPRSAYRMFNAWAIVLTWLAIYELIIRFSTLDRALFYLAPMWPVRLFLIFPLCWYLYRLLSNSRFQLWTFFAFAANALNIGIAFHKPVITSAVASCVVLILVIIRTKGLVRPVLKFLVLSTFGVAGVYYANEFSAGAISAIVGSEFQSKFLHQDTGRAPRDIWEIIDRASGGRMKMWGDSLDKFYESPLIGNGPGQEYGLKEAEAVRLHNVYLEQLVAMGLVGFAPIFLGICLWFFRVFNKRAMLAMDTMLIPVIACSSGILYYCFVGTGDMFNTLIPFCVTLMSISFSLVEHYLENQKTKKSVYSRSAPAVKQFLKSARFPQPGK